MGDESRIAVTEVLAGFVASTEFQSLPDAAVNEAKRAIADCIGGGIAGVTSDVGKVAIATARSETGSSAVWGTDCHTHPRSAALANGMLAHAHDLDDTNDSMRGHPSAPVVPAVLALSEEVGASGKDVITAYVVGVEVEAKLGRAMNIEHYLRGWHTTSTLGTMGAAAATAKILRLNAIQVSRALGIAASTACGFKANWGTMTKPLHAGVAAQNGVLAGQCAAAGLSANPKAIEAENGFFDVFCGPGNARAEQAVEALGSPYDVLSPGIIYKQYPTCALTHLALDIILSAVSAHEIDPDDIEVVQCGVGFRCATALPYHAPKTGLEAKFSMEYCVAVALVRRQCTLAEFDEAAIRDPAIAQMLKKIVLYTHPDLASSDSVDRDFTDIEILFRSGRRFHRRLSIPKGDPRNPLSWDELRSKFETYAGPIMGARKAAALWENLRRLEKQKTLDLFQRRMTSRAASWDACHL